MTRRLQPVEETENAVEGTETLKSGLIVEDLHDYSKRVTVPDSLIRGGVVVVFSDPSHADMEFLEQELSKGKKLEAMKRFACRICTQFGDKDAVSPSQWDKLRGVVSTALMEAINGYFPDGEDDG